jgi:cyclohexanone monooxygenase
VRNNRPTDPKWAESLEPGWQQHRMDNFNTLVSGGFAKEDLVQDGWTDIIGNILLLARKKMEAGEQVENPAELMQLADFKKMEQVRARVDSVVQDPSTAEALKPWYNQFCKRPCFHDEYLTAFNRPNVHLVDTKGKGVERITAHGVVVAGREYEVDCLIYATGFEVGTDYTRRSGYELYGRGGQTLTQKWANGAETLHGLLSRGFPNCFIVSNVQSGFSANFPHMINEQSKHIAYVVKHAVDHQVRTVEPSAEAEEAWVATIVKLALMRETFLRECTPGYYNNEGKPEAMTAKNGSYGAGPVAFTKVLQAWRDEGSLHGLELTR